MTARLATALLAFVIWTAITVLVGRLLAGGETSLLDSASSGIGWAWVIAAGFILAVVLWRGWSDVGLNRGADASGWRLVWLPMLYILAGLGLAATIGLPPVPMLLFLLLNCLFVGFSEELMFRGTLLQAFRHAVPIWPAVILTSFAFGSIHCLNVFVTGELGHALMQASAALLSGLMFIALRLRTGSLWPPILVHALWDFATFTLAATSESNAAHGTIPAETSVPATDAYMALLPVLIVLPNAVYGLWLMRGIGRTHLDPLR